MGESGEKWGKVGKSGEKLEKVGKGGEKWVWFVSVLTSLCHSNGHIETSPGQPEKLIPLLP